MRRSRLLLAVLAGSIVVALAVPVLAGAVMPNYGWFSGHDDAGGRVTFHLYRGPSGGTFLDKARFEPEDHGEFHWQSDFEVAPVHSGGRFGTCAYEKVNEVFSREYCMYGEFGAADRASGKVVISISAGGRRWPKPLGEYRWTAEQFVP